MEWKEILLESLRRQRKYASFFEWPDKPLKELGVVKQLIESIGDPENNLLKTLYPSEKDPPDIIGKYQNGKTIGFEVTELVDEGATRMNAQGQKVYRDWEPKEVLKKIEELLFKKDRKKYHGGPYDKLVFVIHSDEPIIDPINYLKLIENHKLPSLPAVPE